MVDDTTPRQAVPFQVSNPEQIPAQRYYDDDFFALERKNLWPHVWQMAARLEEIPELGDFVAYKNLDKSVIIVRTKTGIKAYHNACRHRGVQLVSSGGNCKTKGFICPFHGWRWNMDGENTFVYARQMFSAESLDRAELSLVPCRVELWGGCAFINFDNAAPPLLEYLGTVAERLDARNVGQLKMEWWYSTVLPVNWKLAMEAFMESYHTMRTHPQLFAWSDPVTAMYGPPDPQAPMPAPPSSVQEFVERTLGSLDTLHTGMAGLVHSSELTIAQELRDMELPDDVGGAAQTFYMRLNDEITRQGQAGGLPMPNLNELAGKYPFHAVEYIFPHYFLLPMFGAMSSYRIRPLTAETCQFEIWSLAFQPDDEARAPVRPSVLPHDSPEFPPIPRQDYDNLPLQQAGLHAQGFNYMRLAERVEGLISNYQRLIDGYLAGLDQETLLAAAQKVNGGFDAAIKDIGLNAA
jgi:phenylpropionate dioxygenase-like ring-hydroxylating dioxygenase large terminal subunit